MVSVAGVFAHLKGAMKHMLEGNLQGLKPSEIKKLEGLGKRKLNPNYIIPIETAKALCEISSLINRQVGLIIDRKGVTIFVLVGDSRRLVIPVLTRFGQKGASNRLRGVRLVHTHLTKEGLTRDDYTDLALLRLDVISVLHFDNIGTPTNIQTAHLLPYNPTVGEGELPAGVTSSEHLYHTFDQNPYHLQDDFLLFVQEIEADLERWARVQPTAKGAGGVGGGRKGSPSATLQGKGKGSHEEGYSRGISAVLIGVYRNRREVDPAMDELRQLAVSAGLEVKSMHYQVRPAVHPSYIMGPGKLSDVVIEALHQGAELLIFDNDLTPTQLKSIANFTELKIIDRSQTILDIFAQRAQTDEGKVRVELAQLKYMLPHLVGMGDALSRLAGGIGTRGPGESKLETDRRRAQTRISILTKRLKVVEKSRQESRKARVASGIPTVSIVGYTNAGKSTLLNALTNSKIYADQRAFATLSTYSRRIRFPEDKEVIITDTVGFIRNMPPNLLGAFRSTINEIADSDLYIHLVDGSSPNYMQAIHAVNTVLHDLELDDTTTLLVFNKIDIVSEEQRNAISESHPDALTVSSLDRKTFDTMLEHIYYHLFIKHNV